MAILFTWYKGEALQVVLEEVDKNAFRAFNGFTQSYAPIPKTTTIKVTRLPLPPPKTSLRTNNDNKHDLYFTLEFLMSTFSSVNQKSLIAAPKEDFEQRIFKWVY